MKAISVLWNSMDSFQTEAIDDIQKFSQIESSIELDLADNFPIFLQDIYSYHAPEEQWKLDYKLQQTINMYNSRKVTIIFLTLREIDTIFDDRKKVEMIRQVKELKDFMRNKYSKLVDYYKFDNVFHMTDNELEYYDTLKIIRKYVQLIKSNKNLDTSFQYETINLNKYLEINYETEDIKLLEKRKIVTLPKNEVDGKRFKFWILKEYMFKQQKKDSFEAYAELFVEELNQYFGFENAQYQNAFFNQKQGVITKSFLNKEQKLISFGEIFYELRKIKKDESDLILFYKSHNNLVTIRKVLKEYFDLKKMEYSNFTMNGIMKSLVDILISDVLTAQKDRHPFNLAIIVENNSVMGLSPMFDNSNIFHLNNPKQIQEMIYLNPDSDNLITYSPCFAYEPKDLIDGIQMTDLFSKLISLDLISNNDVLNKIYVLSDRLEAMLKNIENRTNQDIPTEFEIVIKTHYKKYLQRFNRTIDEKIR